MEAIVVRSDANTGLDALILWRRAHRLSGHATDVPVLAAGGKTGKALGRNGAPVQSTRVRPQSSGWAIFPSDRIKSGGPARRGE